MSEVAQQAPSADVRQRWTPARVFLLVSAAYHLLLGIVGLAIDRTFPLSPHAAASAGSEHIFGIFETNGWHSVLAVLLGVVSAYFAVRPRHAREVALAVGVSQAFAAIALALQDPSNVLLAANGADQVIHTLTAVAGIGSALLTRRTESETGALTRLGVMSSASPPSPRAAKP
jgi:hypothetical protein